MTYTRLTIDQLNNEGCINVLEAFVKLVGDEYRRTFEACCEQPYNEECIEKYEESKNFILSKYFRRLTNLDGKAIIDTFNRQYIHGK